MMTEERQQLKEKFVEKYAKKSPSDPCYGIEININEEELRADLDALLAPTKEKIEEVHNCINCKYNDINPFTGPCKSCINTEYKGWQSKQ